MELTENQLADALDALDQDGARFDFATERWEFQLRLSIDADVDADINHYDCYGRTEKFSHRYVDGRKPRPDDMDGAARKIECSQGDYIWWQPPADMVSPKKWTMAWVAAGQEPPTTFGDAFRSLVEQVTDLLRYGFSIIGLHVWQHLETAHGDMRWVEIDSTYIGGVDSTDADVLRDIVSDLIADLADLS